MAEGGSFFSQSVGEPQRRAFLELDRRLGEVQATIDALSPAHGDLTGLGNDDHPQYLTEARGDARYLQLSGGSLSGNLEIPNDYLGVGRGNAGTYRVDIGNDGADGNILRLKGADDTLNFTVSAGDFSILNSQQSNGLVIYDGTGGVEIWYNGAAVFEADSGGVKVNGTAISVDGHTHSYASTSHTHSYASTSHTHSYLPLSGGTITGDLTVQGSDLYIGKNGGGDSDIHFYDDNSNTWRTMRWDDSVNDWRVEDNGGSMRVLYHSGNIPSYYTTGSSVRALYHNGYGNSEVTAYQTSGSWQTWSGGWATHIICNHGNGSNYYNQTLIMPFWGQPHYMRKEGGANRGPWVMYSSENSNNSGANWTIGRAYVHNEVFVYNMDTTWSYNTVRYNTSNSQLMAYASLRDMKTDITEINPLLDYLGERSLLYDLKPVIFKESEDRIGKDGQPLHTTRGEYAPGFIAEEVHEVAPELTYFDHKGDLVSYSNDALIPHVVAELQRLMPMIEELYGAANPDWVPPVPRPVERAKAEKLVYEMAASEKAANPTVFEDQPEGSAFLEPDRELVDPPEEEE